MRNTKKAFTLVELIVVITILAILATVAFVSLGGQTDNARNTVKKDNLGKLASAVETVKTQGASLKSFLKTANSNLTWATDYIAWDTATNLAALWYYGAGDVNLTALKVKAEDFSDGTNNFKYGYTSRKGGNYELAATLKEGDLEKAYVVGNYQSRSTWSTLTSWTWKAVANSSTRTSFAISATDANKLLPWDIITNWTATGKIISISDSLTSLIIEGNQSAFSTGTSIYLKENEVEWLIRGVNWKAVVKDTENVPYNLQ